MGCSMKDRLVCSSEIQENCVDVPRQVCLTNLITKCEVITKDLCVDVPVAVLRKEFVEVEAQKCVTGIKEVCVSADRVDCENIPKKDCKTVTYRDCKKESTESTK